MEEEDQKMQLFLQAFEKLGERCKEIIRWSMKGEAQEKVAEAAPRPEEFPKFTVP